MGATGDNLFIKNVSAASDFGTGTLNISVPTTTAEALILKTTDDNATKNLFEAQDSSANVLAYIQARGTFNCDLSTDPTNLFIGDGAGNTTTSGTGLVAIGTDVLEDSTSGINNISIGYNSMLQNTEGSNNTAIGRSALQNNTLGIQNTALGNESCWNNVDGGNNSGFGYF